jgi:hypothetical protein
VHDRQAIRRIARAVNKTEKPESRKAFFHAIREQCKQKERPEPGDTLLKKLALPWHKRLKSH